MPGFGVGFFMTLRGGGEVSLDTGLASLCVCLVFRTPPRCIQIFRVSPPRATHFSLKCAKKSKQKKAHPIIRPRLRRGSFAPSLFRGHAAKGHPWPIAALAASMPLNPLHNDSTRPPDGAFGVVCEIGVPE